MVEPASKCLSCGEGGHKPSKCPVLYNDLYGINEERKGGGGCDDDHDDDTILLNFLLI